MLCKKQSVFSFSNTTLFFLYSCKWLYFWLLHVLPSQFSVIFIFSSVNVLHESAKSRAWRACVLSVFTCLRAHLLSVFACLLAYVLGVLACSRTWRALVFDVLACSRAWCVFVFACFTYVLAMMKCFTFLRV